MKQIKKIISCSLFLLLAGITTAAAQNKVIAFPGAEGFGRYATGGRGGTVYHVTNLNDSGTGSLRAGVESDAKRIIVFDVSGTIHLTRQLNIKSNTTIMGQTAPGDGICVADYPCVVNGDNVIVRYMRFRLGNKNVANHEGDGFGSLDHRNIIIDHCSVSWSVDECLSMVGCHDITVQWCISAQSMVNSGHSKGAHGYGGNWGGAGATFHHNLMAHHTSRVPRLGPRYTTQLEEQMDMRNNVLYNWSGEGCYGGEAMKVNIVNNYYKPGPGTTAKYAGKAKFYRIAALGIRTNDYIANYPDYRPTLHIWGKYYVTGNVNPLHAAVTADNWTYGIYEQVDAGNCDGTWTQATKDSIKVETPIDYVAVTTQSAEQAYEKVLAYAGASLHRDAFDNQIISDTREGKATATGSGLDYGYVNSQDDNTALVSLYGSAWPTLNSGTAPSDSDNDGMPDVWETANGLNPNDASDATKTASGTWYTNIELYANSLVNDITIAQNEGGTMMGETLEGESYPVNYTLSHATYQSSTSGNWQFGDGISMTGGGDYKGGDYSFNTFQVDNNTLYTITIPEDVTVSSVTFTGYCNLSGTTTSKLAELNGTDVSSAGYTFPNRSKGEAATYTVALASATTGKLTFKISGGSRTCLAITLNGIHEGEGIIVDPTDDPTPPPTGETSEYTISPATHSDDAWGFGELSISTSKGYSEGHVTSDFTGIKYSRNTDYTINLPAGISVTSAEVQAYSNVDDGTAYLERLGENTYGESDYVFPSRTEKVTKTYTINLVTPASGTMVLRFGGNQVVANVKLITITTGINDIVTPTKSDSRIYNLQGIPVDHPQRGIYIRNGKKYVK